MYGHPLMVQGCQSNYTIRGYSDRGEAVYMYGHPGMDQGCQSNYAIHRCTLIVCIDIITKSTLTSIDVKGQDMATLDIPGVCACTMYMYAPLIIEKAGKTRLHCIRLQYKMRNWLYDQVRQILREKKEDEREREEQRERERVCVCVCVCA